MLEIVREEREDKVRFTLAGLLNEKGSEQLAAALATIDPQQTREVEIDCHRVDYFGSSAFGKLMVFYKKLAAAGGGKLALLALHPTMKLMFRDIKLENLQLTFRD